MTRSRRINSNPTSAVYGTPPLDMLPAALVKVINEVRDLTARQRTAHETLTGLQDDVTIEAARAEDRAEHGRQIRSGKVGVTVFTAQQTLAKDTAAAQHELDGLNAAVEAASTEFRELRDKAHDDPALGAKARKSAAAALTALTDFHAAYTEYNQLDKLRAWLYGYGFTDVAPFPLQELVSLSRNGDRPDRLTVDLGDLITNLKAEIIDPRDLEASE